MDWFGESLRKGEEYEWVSTHPDLTLGLLSYAVASKMHLSTVGIKLKIRQVFEHVFTYAYKWPEDAKNTRNIKGSIIALNSIFMLINQIKHEGAFIYYAPVMCEFAVSSFSQDREKDLIKNRLISMLFADVPEKVSLGIFRTFAYIERIGETVPDTPLDTYQKTKKVQLPLQRILKFQDEHPTQLKFLAKIGIDKAFYPDALIRDKWADISQWAEPPEKEDETRGAKSEPDMHMGVKDSQHIKIFTNSLDELFNRKILDRLDKEKEAEIGKILLYYERLSISSYKVAGSIPVKILQHSLVWNKNKNDLKKAAHPYIEKKASSVPNFVPVLASWCMIHEKEHLADFSLFDKEVSEIFLESSCFFMSIYTGEDKKARWKEIGGLFRLFIRPSTFSGLSRIHARHPWTLINPEIVNAYIGDREDSRYEVTQFYTSKLIQYKHTETIVQHSLEYEAYCEIKQHTRKEMSPYITHLKQHIIDSAKIKGIRLEKAPKQKKIIVKTEDTLEYAYSTIKRYSEESVYLKDIAKTLLTDDCKIPPSIELKEILDRAPHEQKTQIFLRTVYMLILLETNYHSLSNILHIFKP